MTDHAEAPPRDTVHPEERRLVAQAARDLRRYGRSRAHDRLQHEARRTRGTPVPETWIDAVLDEAQWGHRYEVGPPYEAVAPSAEPADPPTMADHPVPFPSSTRDRPGPSGETSSTSVSASPLLQWLGWALVAAITVRVWRSALGRR